MKVIESRAWRKRKGGCDYVGCEVEKEEGWGVKDRGGVSESIGRSLLWPMNTAKNDQ